MKILACISLTILLIGCSKYEIKEVKNNKPPAEQIVTAQLKASYINRLFISLAGRKAAPVEFENALALLGKKLTQINEGI